MSSIGVSLGTPGELSGSSLLEKRPKIGSQVPAEEAESDRLLRGKLIVDDKPEAKLRASSSTRRADLNPLSCTV